MIPLKNAWNLSQPFLINKVRLFLITTVPYQGGDLEVKVSSFASPLPSEKATTFLYKVYSVIYDSGYVSPEYLLLSCRLSNPESIP